MKPSFDSLRIKSLLAGALLLCVVHSAHADVAGDKKRALLAPIKRIVVMPLFFGTDTLAKAAALDTAKSPDKPEDRRAVAEHARLKEYAAILRKLEETARNAPAERTAVRTPYQVVSAEEVKAALKELNLTPEKMFQNEGRLRGAKFPLPDAEAARRLASRLRADALMLGVLDEPRRTSGTYYFDPLYGLDYQPGSTRGKGGFFVLLADGTEVLHDYVETLHPLTYTGKKEYVLADWLETESQVVEDFMDELTRFAPRKP